MKHHAFMLWSLIIFFTPCFGQFRPFSWFTTGVMGNFLSTILVVKPPQPPTNTDKKASQAD